MQLIYFESAPFIDALKQFFNSELNLPLHYLADAPAKPEDMLGQQYKPQSEAQQLMEDVYALGIVDDAVFSDGKSTFDNIEQVRDHQKQYDGILILGVTLRDRKNGLVPARGQLAEITRALNREFTSMPVVVVFQYAHYIAFANCERSAYKQSWREGEKAGRVSLLRDIDIRNVHAGHQRILQGLTVPTSVNSFESLYQYWQKALDVSILNKDFYRDLSNWFFAACKEAKFPDPAENAVERGLIRLITRLIFTWFVKERGLVPEKLFDTAEITTLLNNTDGNSDTYYRAVLQNLFFATLNTEMGKRRFRDNKRDLQNRNKDYGMHQYFRYESTFTDSQKWLDVVKDVPFLNGGLFECLDPEDKDGQRVDGFSDDPKRQAHLPNKLFWGDNWIADLSDIYNSKRQKAAEVKPLLNLLHSYKFTVTENTPLEQDVALDPELLGKVFENLLASYNPETKTTARKQTGSFYTPREIVNYMVEEALHAYLEPTAAGAKTGEGEDALKVLLSDADARHAGQLGFSETQIRALVEAIQRCTILDPACGSGAFPMGALSKMVALLKKLDPENNLWRAAQLNAVAQRLKQESSSSEAKAQAQAQTQKIFEDNNPDYARKLFLIEKCLFGVDIQPVALQITKLRFFIALIIDQNIDRAKDNWGIRALPNLETKFTAANTLISLPQTGSTLFDTTELQKHKAQLFEKRRQHIAPKNRREKKQLEEDDKKLRALIQNELLELRFDEDGARLIADYNPYDQNATAPFFDPEWMFGPDVKDGFDIVIGNPPYISHDKLTEKKALEKFETYEAFADIYCYFIEHGIKNLRSGGVLSFVTSNSYIKADYGFPTRKLIARETSILSLINIDASQVFESATVNVAVLVCQVGKPNVKAQIVDAAYDGGSFNSWVQTHAAYHPQSGFKSRFWSLSSREVLEVKQKIEKAGPTLSARKTKIRLGLATGSNEAFLITGDKRQQLINQNPRCAEIIKPTLRGRDIERYAYQQPDLFILATRNGTEMKHYPAVLKHLDSFGAAFKKRGAKGQNWWNLRACAFFDDFAEEKIVWIELTDRARFALCSEELYLLNTAYFMLPPKDLKPKYLLGILNSQVIWFYLHEIAQTSGVGTARWINTYVSEFPIPTATPVEQAAIASKVEQILAAKAHDPAADVSTLEREIDELVADLYGLDDAEKQLVGIRSRE